jgi:hypothetical protein
MMMMTMLKLDQWEARYHKEHSLLVHNKKPEVYLSAFDAFHIYHSVHYSSVTVLVSKTMNARSCVRFTMMLWQDCVRMLILIMVI